MAVRARAAMRLHPPGCGVSRRRHLRWDRPSWWPLPGSECLSSHQHLLASLWELSRLSLDFSSLNSSLYEHFGKDSCLRKVSTTLEGTPGYLTHGLTNEHCVFSLGIDFIHSFFKAIQVVDMMAFDLLKLGKYLPGIRTFLL